MYCFLGDSDFWAIWSSERKLTWRMLRETAERKAEEHRLKVSGFVTSFDDSPNYYLSSRKDASRFRSVDDTNTIEESDTPSRSAAGVRRPSAKQSSQ